MVTSSMHTNLCNFELAESIRRSALRNEPKAFPKLYTGDRPCSAVIWLLAIFDAAPGIAHTMDIFRELSEQGFLRKERACSRTTRPGEG
jgi:hypothetical protein